MSFSTLLIVFGPSAFILWLFVSGDEFPEPPHILFITFCLGMLIVPALHFLSPVYEVAADLGPYGNPYAMGAYAAFALAAIPEELAKFAVLVLYCMRRPDFDEPMDGIVYGVTVSLGFATLENVFYVMDGGLDVAYARAFTAVPSHAVEGAVMGYFAARWRWPEPGGDGRRSLALAILAPILIHGIYDTAIFVGVYADQLGVRIPSIVQLVLNLLFAGVLFGGIRYVARIAGRLHAEQLRAAGLDGQGLGETPGEPDEAGPPADSPAGPSPEPGTPRPYGMAELMADQYVASAARNRQYVRAIKSGAWGMDLFLAVVCILCHFWSFGLSSEDPDAGVYYMLFGILFLVYAIRYFARAAGSFVSAMGRTRSVKEK